MKKPSKLQFTEEERANPTLEKTISKSEKAAEKLEKAQAKIPKKKIKIKERTFDAETGKTKVRLYFDEVDKPKPQGELFHDMKMAPARALSYQIHKELSEDEKDNIGVEAVHGVGKATEVSATSLHRAHRTQKMKPYRRQVLAEKRSVRADVEYLYQKNLVDNPQSGTNPISKWRQKQEIKKQYLSARNGTTQTTTATSVTQKSIQLLAEVKNKMIRNPKAVIITALLAMVLFALVAMVSFCSVLMQGALQNVIATSYASEDEDIVAVEEYYSNMEIALAKRIEEIPENRPDYDEYQFHLDTIAHDPHQLASYLTAVYQYYDLSMVQGELDKVFDAQYDLSTRTEIQERYRTEKRTGSYTVTNADGTTSKKYYTYTVEVAYDYYILHITLESKSIDAVARELLTAEELEMYEVYMETKGNKPLIFGGGTSDTTPSTDLNGVIFVDGERLGNQSIVDIALSQVGNVGGEPYWSWYGFDSRVEWCATFVSWVFNQAGYSAPKFAACQNQGVPYFVSNGQWASGGYGGIAPGDVIFFDWDNDGHSDHVGIVIGTDGSRVYTVEGNSGDACKVRDYAVGSSVIMGYGLMN